MVEIAHIKTALPLVLCALVWTTPHWLFGQAQLDSPLPAFSHPGTPFQSPSKGVLINYAVFQAYQLAYTQNKDASQVRREEMLDAKLKIPLLNKAHLKLAVGFHYGFQSYAFDAISPSGESTLQWLDGHNLKIAEATIYVTQSLGPTRYITWRGGVSWRGDWEGFLHLNQRQFGYSILGIYCIKPREDFEYGFGLRFSDDPRNIQVLPFGMLNRTFNKHWGLETTLPVKIMARYNFSEASLLLFGPEYTSSRNFLTQGTRPAKALQFRRSAIEISATYQYRFSKWTWLECRAAYAINFNTSLEDPLADTRINLSPGSRLLGSVAFFVSPPKSLIKTSPPPASAGN